MEEIRNCFTKECDIYLNKESKKIKDYFDGGICTYLSEWDPKQTGDEFHRLFAIRFPGATRGCLWLDRESNLISNIKFDETTSFSEAIGCYTRDLLTIVPKWIGKELI